MTASMNQPQNQPGMAYVPPDTRWEDCGIYVEPTEIDLGTYEGKTYSDSVHPGAPQGAAQASFANADTNGPLNERDYAPGRFGGPVDRHIDNQQAHGPSYGEPGPRPYPV